MHIYILTGSDALYFLHGQISQGYIVGQHVLVRRFVDQINNALSTDLCYSRNVQIDDAKVQLLVLLYISGHELIIQVPRRDVVVYKGVRESVDGSLQSTRLFERERERERDS